MDVEECLKEWEDLIADYKHLEATNKEYITKLEEVGELQSKCMKELDHQRYRMSLITSALKRFHSMLPSLFNKDSDGPYCYFAGE